MAAIVTNHAETTSAFENSKTTALSAVKNNIRQDESVMDKKISQDLTIITKKNNTNHSKLPTFNNPPVPQSDIIKNMSQDSVTVIKNNIDSTLSKENAMKPVSADSNILQETSTMYKEEAEVSTDNTNAEIMTDAAELKLTELPRNPHTEDGTWTWTTETCRKIAASNNFLPQVFCSVVQKNIINRFFDFYLVGKLPKDLNVTDLVFSVISIMPINLETEHFIFNRTQTNHYHEDGTLFSLTDEDLKIAEKILAEENEKREFEEKLNVGNLNGEGSNKEDNEYNVDYGDEDDIYDDVRGIYDFDDKDEESTDNLDLYYQSEEYKMKRSQIEERTEILEGRLLYGPVKNAALIDTCRILLRDWESYQSARIILKYFFGVVALTLMRAMTKTYKHLVDVFKNKFYNHVDYIRQEFYDFDFKYCVPHRKCVQACYMAFRERDEKTRIMFAKILINMQEHISTSKGIDIHPLPKNWSVFMTTILNHTANNGWHIYNMYKRIGTRTCSDYLDTITELTTCDATAESWKRIKDFDENGNTYDKGHTLHRWARVVDENYFKHMSYEENYPLSIILLVFIEGIIMDTGVWKAKWITKVSNVETYIDLGKKMYEQYSIKRDEFEEELWNEHGKIPMKYVSSAFRGQY